MVECVSSWPTLLSSVIEETLTKRWGSYLKPQTYILFPRSLVSDFQRNTSSFTQAIEVQNMTFADWIGRMYLPASIGGSTASSSCRTCTRCGHPMKGHRRGQCSSLDSSSSLMATPAPTPVPPPLPSSSQTFPQASPSISISSSISGSVSRQKRTRIDLSTQAPPSKISSSRMLREIESQALANITESSRLKVFSIS